jgi:signal transduction histidine kinase
MVDNRDLFLQLTRDMAMAQDMEHLLQMIADTALGIIPSAQKCVIHLLDNTNQMLLARVCSEPSLLGQEASGIPANVGIAGKALGEQDLVYISDCARSLDYVPLNSGPEIRSLMVAPLYVGGIPLGTLSLSSDCEHAFCAQECDHARTLAAQAAVAIHQVHLMQETVTERERSDAIIESISEGLIILDGERRIVRVNVAMCHMLGLATADLDLPCDIRDASMLEVLLDPSGGTVVGPYEVEMALPNGGRATLRVMASPLLAPARGEVYVVRDTTAERTAAEARSLFISQMSHELRTPLQHILGFVSLINDVGDLTGSDYRRFLNHIEDETYHLARLVDDLVELSRIETGRFSIYMERVQLGDLVGQIANRLIPRAHIRGLALEVTPVEHAIWCLTDPLRVEQVLTNLVENACKFAPADSTVRITVEHDDNDVVVRVQDSGPGIAEEKLSYIFAAFYQVDAGIRNAGMGLGLYISQEIIRALGGDIWAESELGIGSTFSFRLPRLPK